MASTATSSGVDRVHPDYADRADEWQLMRDVVRGPRAVRGGDYLPRPDGFTANMASGNALWAAYKERAQFPEFCDFTVRGMLGVVHSIEAKIQMPAGMEYLWENCDGAGTPLETFHRRVTRELLVVGRYGVMSEAPLDGGDPYLVGYPTESIINWSDRGDFFVIEESRRSMSADFVWEDYATWRVLRLEGNEYYQDVYDRDGVLESTVKVVGLGGRDIARVPLVVVGTVEFGVVPDNPPLLGVGNSSIATYRLDADYRHQLFMGGQETLFISGVEKESLPSVVGAGVVVGLPQGAVAQYVGPRGQTIQATRLAIQDERENAAAMGARLFDTERRGAESGEALKVRRGATSATLLSIAMSSAGALEAALRNVAEMLGLNRDEVVVKPNLDFARAKMTPAEALNLVKMWQSRAISYRTLYENLQSTEIASQERDHEEEQALVDEEQPADLDDPTGLLANSGISAE